MTIFGEKHFLDSEMCSIAKEVDSTIIDEMYKTTVKIGVSVDKDKLRRWLLLCEQLENIDKSEFLDNTTKRGGSADNIIKDIVDLEPHTEPQFTFTDDEKVILRNLSKRYKWIARDEGNDLYVYSNKPHKAQSAWVDGIECNNLSVFNSIFQSIKWQDNEPCEFKNFL